MPKERPERPPSTPEDLTGPPEGSSGPPGASVRILRPYSYRALAAQYSGETLADHR